MYEFLTGPMLILSLCVFFVGLAARAIWYARGLNWQLDRVAYGTYPGPGLKGAVRSVGSWLLPFGTYGWRAQPFMTVAFFLLHLGAVLVPLFLLGHTLILQAAIGVSPPSLPGTLADILSWAALVGLAMLTLRRIALPEVRILTSGQDYLILALSAAPFVTGLLARHHVGDYSLVLVLHILCGELLLILAPFTKLAHIVLFFMSRAQIGMDYGIKRGGINGKGMAW
ncbi:MAG: respiratory nitrate reductase subunit gamma [Desulfobacteraceae bacterium]|jgi:nitrate reductase gamma subunit|nr:respiratory nitrate reductase subunit gamma [Desulfobacteraceae bacterium]